MAKTLIINENWLPPNWVRLYPFHFDGCFTGPCSVDDLMRSTWQQFREFATRNTKHHRNRVFFSAPMRETTSRKNWVNNYSLCSTSPSSSASVLIIHTNDNAVAVISHGNAAAFAHFQMKNGFAVCHYILHCYVCIASSNCPIEFGVWHISSHA